MSGVTPAPMNDRLGSKMKFRIASSSSTSVNGALGTEGSEEAMGSVFPAELHTVRRTLGMADSEGVDRRRAK
jgi:hypothetical protein